MATSSTNLGFPRIGPDRELKKALEAHWAGRLDRRRARSASRRDLRAAELAAPGEPGHRPHPEQRLLALRPRARHGVPGRRGARALRRARRSGRPRHLLRDGARRSPGRRRRRAGDDQVVRHELPLPRPRVRARPAFRCAARALLGRVRARPRRSGITTRPVLLGPISFLLLAKQRGRDSARPRSTPARRRLRGGARAARRGRASTGCRSTSRAWCRDLDADARGALRRRPMPRSREAPARSSSCCDLLRWPATQPRLGAWRCRSPALHLDLVREPEQLDAALDGSPDGAALCRSASSTAATSGAPISTRALDDARAAAVIGSAPTASWSRRPARCCTCPSTSTRETELDPELRAWLAFAAQKLDEIALLAARPRRRPRRRRRELARNAPRLDARRARPRVHDPAVARTARARPRRCERAHSPYAERIAAQRARLGCRCCRPRPSARSRRRPSSAPLRAPLRAGDDRPTAATTTCIARADRASAIALAGGARSRRARARRVRAQRHGRVLRRAARRLRLHRQRLGAELRLALRQAADHLRRRVAARAHDRRLDAATPSRSPTGR